MAPALCVLCGTERALIKRPKNHHKLCKKCFIQIFEDEVHHTITSSNLFTPGERVAIGASGGKDSTVLASVLKTLNERYKYGLELVLLSVDEGIKGYRDDSLETVKRNAVQYDMPLKIVGYDELYGWTMDQVVETVGKKGNCTYCGIFRRQALDRGAKVLDIKHVVTGHNADDVAETVLMNLLRGDLARLSRSTNIMTGANSALSDNVKRKGEPGGCGSANGRSSGGEMAEMEARLRKNQDSAALEVDVGALENQKKDADAQRTMRVPIRNAPAKGKGGTVTRQFISRGMPWNRFFA
ncbi:cytosolic thiouridylase subunit Ctu1 [Pyricularia oryzae]